MWFNLAIGCILLIFSVLIHAFATRYVMRLSSKRASHVNLKKSSKELWISLTVLIMFAASFLEALTWAFTYMHLDAIQSLEEALYFSIVTFTTLGYGDVTLSDQYRLLASIEAANGIIIFGWSTAITMTVVQRFFMKPKDL